MTCNVGQPLNEGFRVKAQSFVMALVFLTNPGDLLGLRRGAGQLRQESKNDSYTDSVGPFRLQYRMSLSEHRKIVSRMQRFAWSHWKDQRSGSVSYRFVTAEGASVNFSLFFEKDEQGSWRVRIERKELRSHRFILGSTTFAYSLQRVDGKRPVGDDYLLFPTSENPLPGKYILDFRDKEGEVIMRWEPENTY